MKILLLFLSLNLFSQSILVEYKILNYEKQYKTDSKQAKMFDTMLDVAYQQRFQLVFNNNISMFTFSSVVNNDQKSILTNNMSRVMFSSNTNVYINKNENRIIKEMLEGELIEDKLNEIKWNITNEQKKIGDYVTFKATHIIKYIGRRGDNKEKIVEAWFCPKLPYSYGPTLYYGLPGLILELTDLNTTYGMTKIVFNSQKKIKFPKGKKIPQEVYDKKMSAFNPITITKKRK